MKRRLWAMVLVAALVLTMLPTTALATGDISDEVDSTSSDNILDASSSNEDESSDTGGGAENIGLPETYEVQGQEQPAESGNTYEVSTDAELSEALEQIEAAEADEAVILLKADVPAPTENYVSSFGVAGKHITVRSEGDELKTLSFSSRGILTGDCTFDNVNVTGRRLFCNGYRTIFTENGQIHLSETLYGGGYKTTVASTYVVIAADGYINPSSSSGLHDVIGGSYQGSVEGDTYLGITGSLQMQGGNHLNPGCVTGDGTSGDGKGIPAVYVGGNATLIYDNPNGKTSPAIEGSYGCEMMGNVTLDIRSGRANEICGQNEYPDESTIHGNLHIIAGSPDYENTDRTLRINGNWPIAGAGNSFAASPFESGKSAYKVEGDITIDTYENLWGWDKGTDPSDDIPEIYGAIKGDVGGSITINAHGSHMENITGASDSSTVGGDVTINATDVELKNYYYEDPDYDEGDIYGLYSGSTSEGKVTINVDGGDTALLLLTTDDVANDGSSINITGKPKIRVGILGTVARSLGDGFPTVNVHSCQVDIPFIQAASQINVTNRSEITVHEAELDYDLNVAEGSSFTTEDSQIHLWGNAMVNGTWEQKYDAAEDYNDIYVKGTTTIGENGRLIDHGTSDLKGAVTNNGLMVLMAPAYLQSDYTATKAELRLPAVTDNYNGTDEGSDIPVFIKGISSGTTTVNTVKPDDWQTLQAPKTGDNYILSAKDGGAPLQKVFLLGNEDALEKGYFLKRLDDADTSDDTYYMWQVASGIRVIFDKNGGDTEASPRIVAQDKVEGVANHFDLPATEPIREGYNFKAWNTKADGTGTAFTAETDVTENMTVYAQWEPDEAYSVTITPMDITIYVGGNGHYGAVDGSGNIETDLTEGTDLPEIGYYVTLPDDILAQLGSARADELSEKLTLTYNDEQGVTRKWGFELYGSADHSTATVNGKTAFIYKMLPSQINGTAETVPVRMQFTDSLGNVMIDSAFPVSDTDQFRNYKVNFYSGDLNEKFIRAEIQVDGNTISRPVKLGTGELKVRGNTDETYRVIEENTVPSVDPNQKNIFLVSTSQSGTQYFINNSGITADPEGVRLLVDHSLDDQLLTAYIDRTSNANGKYTYEFRYLDLVDTHNGNAYVTLGSGQKMDVYWPVPSDASANSDFRIVHFTALNRDSDVDMNELLANDPAEEIHGETVTIDGQRFIKFSVGSFSPFALLYEKDTSTPTQPSGGGGSSSGSTKYILHYESNGGTSYKDESYSYGTTISLDKIPTRESYTFTGWYADKELTTKISSVKMTSNKTVYAGWQATGVPDMLNGDDHYAYVVGYTDGMVHPNANISRAEVATIFFRLLKEDVRSENLTTNNIFEDVLDGQWYNMPISTMAKLGGIKGRSAESFDPDAPITRAEFATICARFDTTQINSSSNFSDISGHWAEKDVERAATLGWIAGYSDGTFRPNNYITRAEAMTMINRVLCRIPQSEDDLLSNMIVWPDNKPTDWYYLAVQEATNSHDFERKGEVNEKWTQMIDAPDWSRYQ